MRSSRIVPAVAGVFLFFLIVLTFVWFLSPSKLNGSFEIQIHEVAAKINNRQIKEINFKQSMVEITDNSGVKYYANLSSDASRESLLGTVKEYNKINSSAPLKFNEEPVSSGWGWIVVINALPIMMFFLMWAATLAVIVYAVRTLSRNKS